MYLSNKNSEKLKSKTYTIQWEVVSSLICFNDHLQYRNNHPICSGNSKFAVNCAQKNPNFDRYQICVVVGDMSFSEFMGYCKSEKLISPTTTQYYSKVFQMHTHLHQFPISFSMY
jgi:hypothetical protein